MGDGGKLFLRENGQVEYFTKQGSLVYRMSDPVRAPQAAPKK
jgi:hypothetical protein